jgi:hypothetical protein
MGENAHSLEDILKVSLSPKPLYPNLERKEITDRQTKEIFKIIVQQSPQVFQDIRNTKKKLFYVEFLDSETQRLFEEGYYKLLMLEELMALEGL